MSGRPQLEPLRRSPEPPVEGDIEAARDGKEDRWMSLRFFGATRDVQLEWSLGRRLCRIADVENRTVQSLLEEIEERRGDWALSMGVLIFVRCYELLEARGHRPIRFRVTPPDERGSD